MKVTFSSVRQYTPPLQLWHSALIGKEILKRLAEKVKEETDLMPIVIVTSGFFTRVDSPLGKQLRSTAEQIGGQFVKWLQLFEEKGVDRVKIAGKNWDNLPEQIAALSEKLHAEAGGKRTLVMIDELSGYDAPEDEEKTTLNWTALERIPKQVFLVLLFNPGFYDGKHLRLPSSCLSLHLPTTYRSTKGIINLHSCIATALERNAPSGNPGTEVEGELPKLVVLGDLGELEEEEAAARIRFGFNMVQSFVAGSEMTVMASPVYWQGKQKNTIGR